MSMKRDTRVEKRGVGGSKVCVGFGLSFTKIHTWSAVEFVFMSTYLLHIYICACVCMFGYVGEMGRKLT